MTDMNTGDKVSEERLAELRAILEPYKPEYPGQLAGCFIEGVETADICALLDELQSLRRPTPRSVDGAEGVVVKPLYWSSSKVFGSTKWRGSSPFGEFAAFVSDDMSEAQILERKERYETDYRRAILSTLAPSAPLVEEAKAEDGKTWFELREPGCVPECKGPIPATGVAAFLRELFAHRPSAYVTVITWGHDGPLLEDGPECLQMLDGRSMSTGRKHIASSSTAHQTHPAAPTALGQGWVAGSVQIAGGVLNEAGLAAALDAWTKSVSQTGRQMIAEAILAYLSAAPSPAIASGVEVTDALDPVALEQAIASAEQRLLTAVDANVRGWQRLDRDGWEDRIRDTFKRIRSFVPRLTDPTVEHERWMANRYYRAGYEGHAKGAGRNDSPYIAGFWAEQWQMGWDYADRLAVLKSSVSDKGGR